MNTNTIATRRDRRNRKNKSRPIVAVVLAALAIGGVGAAATSAAWSDNVFFTAQAQAATFNLQGSLDGSTWVESDNSGAVQLVVPSTTFANLLPGQSRTVNLHVKNLGSVSAALTGTATFSASTFTTNPTAVLGDLAATLTPASGATASDQFTLTITAPSDWATSNQGKSGTVLVTITGTATA